MQYLNLHISRCLRSPEAIGSSPAELGTWLRVLAYCAEQENGGRIVGAKRWKSRQWQQMCAVTLREIQKSFKLLRWENDDLVVAGYAKDVEEKIQNTRKRQQLAAKSRWDKHASAYAVGDAMAYAVADAKEKEKEKEKGKLRGMCHGITLDTDQDHPDNIDDQDILAAAKPLPLPRHTAKASILDWVAMGHPRVNLRGDEKTIWQAYLDRWSLDPGWQTAWQEMYDTLVDDLEQPTHKIFSQQAIEWLDTHFTPEIPDHAEAH